MTLSSDIHREREKSLAFCVLKPRDCCVFLFHAGSMRLILTSQWLRFQVNYQKQQAAGLELLVQLAISCVCVASRGKLPLKGRRKQSESKD
jgi:hypothetical protein